MDKCCEVKKKKKVSPNEKRKMIYVCGSKKIKHTQDKFEVFSSGTFLGATAIEKYSNK